MKKTATAFTTERRHLLEIIDGLIEGIILLDNNRHIAWANDTALAMHGVADLARLGGTAAGYRKAYTLRYRNNRKLDAAQYPMDRALAGEAFRTWWWKCAAGAIRISAACTRCATWC